MRRLTTWIVISSLAVTACGGGDDDDEANDDPPAAEIESANPDTDGGDAETPEAAADDAVDGAATAEPPGPNGSGDGTATMTLATGESYEFSILCTIEPQMAAGSEILFTAVSYDDPSLDITQFGDEGQVTGVAVVQIYDAVSYDTLWEAGSIYEAFGGNLDLSLDGSTITANGSFYPAADPAAEPVDGEVVANC